MLRGIPNHLRLELWPILAEVQQLKEKKQFEYQGHTGEEDNPCAKQIEMDVRRTYRGTTFQRAENVDRLRRILLAFARLDPEVGYVQGMNIIVAQLMMLAGLECEDEIKALLISPEQEETLFWLFASLMLQRNYRTMFLTGMVGLQEELAELEKAVAKIHPKLMAHWN